MAKYNIQITSSVEENVKYFEMLNMKIIDEGLRIRAASKTFGDYFIDRSVKTPTGKPSTFQGGGLFKGGRYLAVDHPLPPEIQGFIRLERDTLFWDSLPNLLWLLHVDLSKGFELVIPTCVSLNDFEDYFMGCTMAVQHFHQLVLRKGELEAVLGYVEEKEA